MEKLITKKSKNKTSGSLLVRCTIIIIFFILWEEVAKNSDKISFYTSYPSELFSDLIVFASSGDLAHNLAITLEEAYLGFFLGCGAGLILGVLFSQFSFLGKVLVPIITAIQGIPQLTLAPLYILWFGVGLESKVFLSGLMVFFNVFFSTYDSIKNIDQKLIESAVILGARKIDVLTNVVIPYCMPWILSGMRMGISACMVGAIIGEYLGASGGLGWMVTYASSFFRIERVMSTIIILMLIGLITNFVFAKIESYVLRWRAESNLSVE